MVAFSMSRRRIAMVAAAVAVSLSLGSVLGLGTVLAAASPNEVVIENFSFTPAVLTVPRGAKVIWLNRDDEPHTVVSTGDAKTFKSPALDTEDSFTFTFDTPGTYKYFCTVHPHMQGTIVVQ